MAAILTRHFIGKIALKRLPIAIIGKRTDTDFCADKIGKREIVGYGWNGCPSYLDRPDFPFPSIRFMEPTNEICTLREKEKSDWKKLSICDKRALYRYSFCQTFAEMKASTGEWKFVLGTAFWIISMAFALCYSYYYFDVYPENPPSFDECSRRAQLKRMLDLEINPIDGLSSKWDFENDRWNCSMYRK